MVELTAMVERLVRLVLLVILCLMALEIVRTGFATANYLSKERIVYLPQATEVFPAAFLSSERLYLPD